MLVSVFVCHTCYNCTKALNFKVFRLKEFHRTSSGPLQDFQKTSAGLPKDLQVAAPRSSRLVLVRQEVKFLLSPLHLLISRVRLMQTDPWLSETMIDYTWWEVAWFLPDSTTSSSLIYCCWRSWWKTWYQEFRLIVCNCELLLKYWHNNVVDIENKYPQLCNI